MAINHTIWKAEVRDYEVDFQGIVNNAVYFHYLDHARVVYLRGIGINIIEYSKRDINIVLTNSDISFKKSLKFGDLFYVESKLVRVTKLKFLFKQSIYNQESGEIVLAAENFICCVNKKTGKPCVIEKLNTIKENYLS